MNPSKEPQWSGDGEKNQDVALHKHNSLLFLCVQKMKAVNASCVV